MKSQKGFWGSFENYTWKVVERASPSLPYFAAGLVFLMIGSSIVSGKASLAGAGDLREASLKAVRVGDYNLARKFYTSQEADLSPNRVMGVESQLEELVYPERVVWTEIEKYESLLTKYPGHRDILLVLSKLYLSVSERERANEYYELARELDPNNVIFGE